TDGGARFGFDPVGRDRAARRRTRRSWCWRRPGAGQGSRVVAPGTGSHRRRHQLDHPHRLLRAPRCSGVAHVPTRAGEPRRGGRPGRWPGRCSPGAGEGVSFMSTETVRNAVQGLDAGSAGDIMRAIPAGNARAIRAVEAALPDLEAAADGIEPRLRAGGRLFYAGAGTSGRLGVMDAAELAPTFGFDRTEVLLAGGGDAHGRAKEGAEDDVDAATAAVDLAQVGHLDALIGVAASGKTPYTVAAVRRAKERGAFTV